MGPLVFWLCSWKVRALEELLDWVYPPKCGLCARLGCRGVCDACRTELEAVRAGAARILAPLDSVHGLYRYEGRAAQAVRRLKFSRATSLAEPMALDLAVSLSEMDAPDVVIPVPIHWRRRFSRGFNQAELLSQAMPRRLIRNDLLRRTRHTPQQARLPAELRAANLVGAFSASPGVRGLDIVLLDDVYTTGHTAAECARALLAGGAGRVRVLAFAVAMPGTDRP